jgi:hypothetical protein
MKPSRHGPPRVEDAVAPHDPRNRVDRGHLHRPRRLERMCDAVPREAGREEGNDGRHKQKQKVNTRRPVHAPMDPRWFGAARRWWRRRLSKRWRGRKIVLRRLPRREGAHARREDTHASIVELTPARVKPLKGRALGGRFG